jgi:hypothetical protein
MMSRADSVKVRQPPQMPPAPGPEADTVKRTLTILLTFLPTVPERRHQ